MRRRAGCISPCPSPGCIFRLLGPQQGLSSTCSQAVKLGPASPAATLQPLHHPISCCDLWAVALRAAAAARLCRMVPRGRLSATATAARRGKWCFRLHPPSHSGAFFEPKGRKGCGLALLLPLRACPFIPLFPAAANGFACERSHLSVLCAFSSCAA